MRVLVVNAGSSSLEPLALAGTSDMLEVTAAGRGDPARDCPAALVGQPGVRPS